MMKLRKAKEIRDADDREEVARAIAAGELEAAADAGSSSSSDADETVEKKRVEVPVSDEVELSSDFIRASLRDRSDLFGPRPTVPLTKRARLDSYVDSVRVQVQV